jgi:Transposase, Mutator family
VQAKPAYLAVGIDTDGEKHVLGIWLAKTPLDAATAGEGARFWASAMTDLRNRGVRDVLIACSDHHARRVPAEHLGPAARVAVPAHLRVDRVHRDRLDADQEIAGSGRGNGSSRSSRLAGSDRGSDVRCPTAGINPVTRPRY